MNMNAQTIVEGFKVSEGKIVDWSTLTDKLNRTGHYWWVENIVKTWAEQSEKVAHPGSPLNFRDFVFIVDEVKHAIAKWDDVTGVEHREVASLVGELLQKHGYV